MTDYTKTTDFTSKDSLPSGDSGKIIRGAEFGTEFDNIQTAVNSKSNKENPSFTGNITVTGTVDGRDIAADGTKLDTVETSADVTDTANVTAAGAVMDSELTNIAAVKALNQGVATTDSPTFAAVTSTGNVTVGGTVDGRDVAADGTKLDGIEAGATADQTAAQIKTAYESNADTNAFTDADHTKLDGIEASADVTDATNVTAAGALMDSEVTNLAQVKAFDSSDYATAAQGTTADNALPKTGGAMTGAITTNSTFDGRDVATDGTKLDGIEASADVTDTANVTAAGALMDSELTSEASVKALNQGVATTDSPTFAGATVNGTVEFDGLSGTGAVTVTDILDQDDMSGNSATALATQQSIKSYVDSQVATSDTLAEVLANGNATGGTDVAFGDNDKALFGAGSDLQIYHDGSNSYIDDAGTGDLLIRAENNLFLKRTNSDETYLSGAVNGAVTLFHNNNAKLETTISGIDVTGTVVSDGLTVDGTGTFTTADNSAQVTLISTDTDALVGPQLNLWRNSGTGTNGDLIGQITFTGEDTVGSTNTFASIYSVADQTNNGSEDGSIHFQTLINGVLADRLEINSAGNTVVTGTVTADGLTVDGTSTLSATDSATNSVTTGLKVGHNTSGTTANGFGSALEFEAENSTYSAVNTHAKIESVVTDQISIHSDLNVYTKYNNSLQKRMSFNNDGDISFYEDTGTTAKFFWDASAESLGIGTSSPSSKLHVANAATEEYIFETTNNNTRSQVEIKSKDSSGNAVQTRIGSIGDGVYGMLYTFTNHNLSFATNNAAPQMTLDTSGNVGIGVAPSSPLHVNVGTNQNLEIDSAGSELRLSAVNDARSTNPAIRFQAESYKFYGAGGVGPRATIDSSGNVGIGTDSPSAPLSFGATLPSDGQTIHTYHSGNIRSGLGIVSGVHRLFTDSGSALSFGQVSTSDGSTYTERMRIDSSGHLLVGSTSAANASAGFRAYSGGNGAFTSSATSLSLNRLSSDGEILSFQKDTTSVGSIGAFSSRLFIGSGDTGIFFDPTTDDAIKPWNTSTNAGRDAAIDLGDSGTRFKDLHLSGNVNAGNVQVSNGGKYIFGGENTRITGEIDGSGKISMFTGGTEKVTLSGGNLLVGGTSLGDSNSFGVSSSGNITIARASGTPRSMIDFKNGGASVGSVTTSTTATTYNTTSDQRLKDNIVDAPSASDDIDAIQVRSFDWKTNGSHQKYGMVAQELNTVAPEAVSAPEDPEEMMGVDYSKLVPMLVKEIQSLRARVAQLETN